MKSLDTMAAEVMRLLEADPDGMTMRKAISQVTGRDDWPGDVAPETSVAYQEAREQVIRQLLMNAAMTSAMTSQQMSKVGEELIRGAALRSEGSPAGIETSVAYLHVDVPPHHEVVKEAELYHEDGVLTRLAGYLRPVVRVVTGYVAHDDAQTGEWVSLYDRQGNHVATWERS